ncbi:MAG: hypothetical protein R3199_11360 [Gemmatimonadota bacterium]|nr:hypothetical protein [Gemmatimonadota bacterium]
MKARLVRLALPLGIAASLGCASAGGGAGDGDAERVFHDWGSFFEHHAPRAEVRGDCVLELGRGGVSMQGGEQPPPVIEVDGSRYDDGCIPPGIRPHGIADVQILSSAQATTILGSRGAGGLVRLKTQEE